MSTIELNKVIEGQSGDDEANKQRAEFFMGKALFNLKYYSASLFYFDRIVQKGPAHRYYQKTLQWLASLSRFLPESAGVLEKIGKYSKQDLDQPVARAGHATSCTTSSAATTTRRASSSDAIELFTAVPEKSEFFPKAQFFAGMTRVRENKGKEAVRVVQGHPAQGQDLRRPGQGCRRYSRSTSELANLSLGRVFYATHAVPICRSSTSRRSSGPTRAAALRATGCRRCSRPRGPTSRRTATPRRSATSTR